MGKISAASSAISSASTRTPTSQCDDSLPSGVQSRRSTVERRGNRFDAARTVRVRRHTDVSGRGHRYRDLYSLVRLTTEARRKLERKMQREDHEQYLAGLTKVLERASAKRLIVMGDFNQTIGAGSRARPQLRLALQDAFPPSMTIATSTLAFQGRRSIDHIALSADLAVGSLGVISNIHEGRELSDHFGVFADLSAQHFQ